MEHTLSVLAERSLVMQLPRHPGTKEPRWGQLLSGEPADVSVPGERPVAPRVDRLAALESQVAQLSAEVAVLRGQLSELLRQLS